MEFSVTLVYVVTIPRKKEKRKICSNLNPNYCSHITIIFICFTNDKGTNGYKSIQIKAIKAIQCGLGNIHTIIRKYIVQVVISYNLSIVVIHYHVTLYNCLSC